MSAVRLRQLRIELHEVLVARGPSSRLGDPWSLPGPFAAPEWHPPTDLYESHSEWIATLEIGGLRDEDFEVVLCANHLIVRGERPWRPSGDATRLHAAEIRYGPFLVSIHIPDRPDALDLSRAQVRYENGLLRIRLPKVESP